MLVVVRPHADVGDVEASEGLAGTGHAGDEADRFASRGLSVVDHAGDVV